MRKETVQNCICLEEAEDEEYLKKSEVLALLHNIGGCDATDDFAKGWDDAILETYRAVNDMKVATGDDLIAGLSETALYKIYGDIEKEHQLADISNILVDMEDDDGTLFKYNTPDKLAKDHSFLSAVNTKWQKSLEWCDSLTNQYWSTCEDAIKETIKERAKERKKERIDVITSAITDLIPGEMQSYKVTGDKFIFVKIEESTAELELNIGEVTAEEFSSDKVLENASCNHSDQKEIRSAVEYLVNCAEDKEDY